MGELLVIWLWICNNICEKSINSIKNLINKNTCAVLVEPIQGEGGIVTPKTGWLKQLRDLCTENNVLLILDEIQSGLARTGKLFAYQHENIEPERNYLRFSIDSLWLLSICHTNRQQYRQDNSSRSSMRNRLMCY